MKTKDEHPSVVGQRYFYGEFVKRNYRKAFPYLLKAALAGDVHPQNLVGYCYDQGLGVEKDLEQAVFWFKRAAKHHHKEAIFNLALMYERGEGVKADSRKAFALYKRAALLGDAQAQCNLGVCYLVGGRKVKFRITVSLVLIVTLATPPTLLAQTWPEPVRGSWDGLKAIPPGDELVVELRGRGAVKGRLSGVSDTTLTLTRGQTPTEVSRADALKIYRLTPKSHKKAMLIGLGLGAGIGAGIGGNIVAGGGESGESWPIALLGGVGAAFGALGGYLIGRGKRKDLIYETR